MRYNADYPKDTSVKIASRPELEQFLETWHLHNPLRPEQLQYAARTGRVISVGYYHGGDVLYEIEGIPGIWHECCLRPAIEAQNSN